MQEWCQLPENSKYPRIVSSARFYLYLVTGKMQWKLKHDFCCGWNETTLPWFPLFLLSKTIGLLLPKFLSINKLLTFPRLRNSMVQTNISRTLLVGRETCRLKFFKFHFISYVVARFNVKTQVVLILPYSKVDNPLRTPRRTIKLQI